MAWRTVEVCEAERELMRRDRLGHEDRFVRQKLDVLWLLHYGLKQAVVCEMTGVSRKSVDRYLTLWASGGLEAVYEDKHYRPTSALEPYRELLVAEFQAQPPRTVAEAAQRIEQLTGVRRCERAGAVVFAELGPVVAAGGGRAPAPKKSLAEHVATQRQFLDEQLTPVLEAAQAGQGHVFFVDAAHFVYGTFLCCLWSFGRLFLRAAAGRQRFNVLGAWNAVTRELIAVTNTTVVNTETMCQLLRKIAASNLVGPITLVLDNARYQRNAIVQALAAELGIKLLFLPSYSPNLNLIERLWKFVKGHTLRGRHYANFASFRAAIEDCLAEIPTTHQQSLASRMTLRFQTFENVSLVAG